ncbi:dTDP-4-dehydrorhamnose 3,5-epimerase family protein [Candidatus Pelagibacter sp.]|jgi:dTDP-4-dehydrorhamnose 3,5-epimerase|nr:dTDP-4-dehydrorhamnose 3,5-epimerase family protein [Candidatus Pelagibacter sp.]
MKLDLPFKFRVKKYIDKRGYLSELLNKKKINLDFKHSIISLSKQDVIRGLHFRTKPEYKILFLLKGRINDYCVNLRNKKKYLFKLKSMESLLIPPGYAHGYECLGKENILIYFLSWPYDEKLQSGIYYKDKNININWTVKKPIISVRDKNLQSFLDILKKKYY